MWIGFSSPSCLTLPLTSSLPSARSSRSLLLKIRIDIPAADISDVMDDVASLLDYSIATQGYVIKASETTNYIDLSQIDFDALRAKFDKRAGGRPRHRSSEARSHRN